MKSINFNSLGCEFRANNRLQNEGKKPAAAAQLQQIEQLQYKQK